jgi:hypothetical protein
MMASDGKGGYREALLQTWGEVPEYRGRGRPPTVSSVPNRNGSIFRSSRIAVGAGYRRVSIKVVYGQADEVISSVGAHTAYVVERTNLSSRQMNGRLVRKTLSYSKQLDALEASCAWEDWVYNLGRPLKTLAVEELEMRTEGQRRRWKPVSPAMAAGLTDHVWSVKELLSTVVRPQVVNTK